jgi:hypothetical protein
MYPDTPIPQEEPAGQNPLDGAVINYYLDKNVNNISLEILDAKNNVVRKYSSLDTMYKIGDVNIPHYWIRPQQILSATAGSHRFMWDMHYTPLNVPPSYPISATYMNTAPEATSPWVLPGTYTARLTVDGKVYTQNFIVKMDPRVKTGVKDLQLQHDLSLMCYNNIKRCMDLLTRLNDNASAEKQKVVIKFQNAFTTLHNLLQESDMPPTKQMLTETIKTETDFKKLEKN